MPKTGGFWRWALLVPWLFLATGAVILLQFGRPTPVTNPGPPELVLRYRLDPDRFIRLEVSPGTPGPNTFRATLLNRDLQPLAADGLNLRLWRLDRDDPAAELRPDSGQLRFEARSDLEPGWWAVEAGLAGGPSQTFYLQVGPADPTATPDPTAVARLNRAIETFGQLTAVRWEEQLTSGLPYPTAAGGWVLTEGEARAPDRIHLKITLDGSARETYQVGGRRCDRDDNGPWQCADAPPVRFFDRAAFRAAVGVSLGRRETVGAEPARVIFFYFPPAEAWYAWWVGEESGLLLREVMVAPGHIMASRYFDQDAPLSIELPAGG